MCNEWDLDTVARALPEPDVRGKRVLEVGSLDVVCDAAGIDQRFGPDAFDVVISTELLEHARECQKIIHNFKYVLRPGGVLVVTTRSFGVDFHRQPYDFWRYEKDDFELIFSDMEVEDLQLDPSDPGLFIKARKPVNFVERDLSQHQLYSILRQKKKREATDLDIVLFEIRYRFVRLLMDLLPKRYRRAVHEGLLR